MVMNRKMTAEQSKQLSGLIKPKPQGKPMGQQPKVLEKSQRTLPIRGA